MNLLFASAAAIVGTLFVQSESKPKAEIPLASTAASIRCVAPCTQPGRWGFAVCRAADDSPVEDLLYTEQLEARFSSPTCRRLRVGTGAVTSVVGESFTDLLALTQAPDVDGDGVRDVGVLQRNAADATGVRLLLLSGRDLHALVDRKLRGDGLNRLKPDDVRSVSITSQGPASWNVQLGIPIVFGRPPHGTVLCWNSGAETLAWRRDSSLNDALGSALAEFRGTPDDPPVLLCGARLASATMPDGESKRSVGRVVAVSFQDGRELWSLPGTRESAQLGGSLCVLPDLDADGIADLAIGAPFASGSSSFAGEVSLVSGKTRQVLQTISGWSEAAMFGLSCARIRDVDGKGLDDLAVGAQGNSSSKSGGAVFIVSLETREPRIVLQSNLDCVRAGASAVSNIVVSKEGNSDLVIFGPATEMDTEVAGRIWIVEGAALRGLLDAQGAEKTPLRLRLPE